jgi:ubiquinone biosynthesis protein
VLLAAGDRDSTRLAEVIAITCKAPSDLDRAAMSADLMEVFGQFGSQSMDQFDVGGALTSVTRIIHEYKLVMPSRLSMLIKALIVLEGTGKILSPKFNLAGLLQPYRNQFVLHQFSPQVLLRKAKRLHRDLELLIETVPRGVNTLMEQLQNGLLSIRHLHPSLESAVNRLVYGLLVSVLMASSALLWSHDVPPTIHGLSVFGFLGYLLSGFLGAQLIWTIHRLEVSRRRKKP